MAIQDKKIAKKRGRPATGTGRTVGVRVRPELSAQIEGWRAQQRPIPSEPEAIRRLVEIGLGSVKVARAQKRSDSPTAPREILPELERAWSDPAQNYTSHFEAFGHGHTSKLFSRRRSPVSVPICRKRER